MGKSYPADEMKHDIVYILKNNMDSDEIRYSLRSVEKNFPYNKVWFYGGCPEGIVPDEYVNFQQVGETKWQRSTSALAEACKNDDITENFWLFNDDFFVMKKARIPKPYITGTLMKRCKEIESRHQGMTTSYTRQMRRTDHALKINGYTRYNYALHVPMLINRAKALETLNTFSGQLLFRPLYGNYCGLDGVVTEDVKIFSLTERPQDPRFLSTNDESFAKGQVGELIRKTFPEPSKYEV